jgi:beta-1,4-N-acetylglucosaminyltransferase
MASDTASRLLSVVSTKRCLITVGTTNFDSLIRHLDSPGAAPAFLATLTHLGMTELTIQIGGTATYRPTHLPSLASALSPPVAVNVITLVPALLPLLSSSSLIISHAGAGSIVEALRLRLPLLVVVNEALMDNHQLQLARALACRRYLWMAQVSNILQVLNQLKTERLIVQPAAVVAAAEDDDDDEEAEDEDDDDDEDESKWGSRGERVHVDYSLRPYPAADSSRFIRVLEQELDAV